jgi:glutamate mutase epsilon subunit
MDAIYKMGDGDLEAGTIAAFAAGVMNVPFAPSIYNNGKILPMRDNEGYTIVNNELERVLAVLRMKNGEM